MLLFETTLLLLLIALALLQVARYLSIPYPTLLAAAGIGVAALPWHLRIEIEPRLAMALFIAPAILDAAFDFPPRALRRYWLSLIALAGVAVVLTTAAVAWLAVEWGALPLAAAIALGAIVSPPDAAAATAMLNRFPLPRAWVTVLKGESLLNDAIALLIYGAAVGAIASQLPPGRLALELSLAAPGGLLLGYALARIGVAVSGYLMGTLGNVVFSFVAIWVAWILADRLHLSAILAVVAYGMTAAHYAPYRTPARDRVRIYAVWEVVVFVLNVLAFLLVGFEARHIVTSLGGEELWHAARFAGGVVATVVVVRIAWVALYYRLLRSYYTARGRPGPGFAQTAVVSWCGMRGLVTLATALALPQGFPGRDLIVLAALAVVLGTLVLQGLTLGPLIRALHIPADNSAQGELRATLVSLLDAVIADLRDAPGEDAQALLRVYQEKRERAGSGGNVHEAPGLPLRRRALAVQREKLHRLRMQGQVDDDIYHEIEAALDRVELGIAPNERAELLEG
ncbi:MAG: sodium:proton antiporter [Proteobacteria bacterium]|nr:sodium:proton antiporter [Pseudomonadota bacterium]